MKLVYGLYGLQMMKIGYILSFWETTLFTWKIYEEYAYLVVSQRIYCKKEEKCYETAVAAFLAYFGQFFRG